VRLNYLYSSLAFLSLAAFLNAATWNDSDIFIESIFQQTDDSGSTLNIQTPYSFRASAKNNLPDQVQSVLLPTNAGYGQSSVTEFNKIGAHYVFSKGYLSLDALNTDFPLGNYIWHLHGSGSEGLVSISVNLSTAIIPSFQPEIVGGTWENGRLLLDATSPSFSVRPWLDPPSNVKLEFELWRDGGSGGSSTSNVGASSVNWSSQPSGAIFDATLSYKVLGEEKEHTLTTGNTLASRTGVATTLHFQIEMVGDSEEPNPNNGFSNTSDPSTLYPAETSMNIIYNGDITISWSTELSRYYLVQTSTDLVSWSASSTLLSGDGEILSHEALFNGSKAFFRLLGSDSPLIITEARYGANDTYTDVLQYVADSALGSTVNLSVGNHTLGGDPIFGTPKILHVRYQNSEGRYEALVNEGDTLIIPSQTHSSL